MCNPDTQRILHVDSQNDNDGEPVEAYVERTFHTVGGEQSIWQNVLTNVRWPNITGSDGDQITIRIGGSQSPTTPITWGAEVVYPIGDQPPHIPTGIAGHGRFRRLPLLVPVVSPGTFTALALNIRAWGKY